MMHSSLNLIKNFFNKFLSQDVRLPILPSTNIMDTLDLLEPNNLTEEDYVKLSYIVLLQRKIDPVGMNYWIEKIKHKSFNYKDFLDTIISSPEFIMHYKIPFEVMLHQGRKSWCQSLEKFDLILDIGGSSPNIAEGALIELGYTHKPKEIIIFDQPEDRQYWGKPKFPQDRDYEFGWGTLRYVHGYAEKIDTYEDLSNLRFDLIFMGQTIEHIQKDSLDLVLTWVKKHLNTGGKFVFDTPNRDITKIQMPDSYIDEDHKYEYVPSEMESIVNRNGLIVNKKFGILDMPKTSINQEFNPLEVYNTKSLNNNPETSYVFAFECIAKE